MNTILHEHYKSAFLENDSMMMNEKIIKMKSLHT